MAEALQQLLASLSPEQQDLARAAGVIQPPASGAAAPAANGGTAPAQPASAAAAAAVQTPVRPAPADRGRGQPASGGRGQGGRSGAALPAGMVAVANRPPRAQRATPSRPKARAPAADRVNTVRSQITAAVYTNVLSAEPLWCLANTYLPEAERLDAEDDDEEEGVHAVMGPPSVGGIPSVPQPIKANVSRPKLTKKRKAISGEDGYTWEANDNRDAMDALRQLRALRMAYPPDGPPPSDEKLMDMFALWFKYFVFAEGAAHAPGGHGLKMRKTRNNYAQLTKRLTSPAGRAVFTSLDCLPKANDQAESHRFRDYVVHYFGSLRDNAHAGALVNNPDKREIECTVSWAKKYLDMFPPGDLAYFVRFHQLPTGSIATGASSRRGESSHAATFSRGACPLGANVVELDDED